MQATHKEHESRVVTQPPSMQGCHSPGESSTTHVFGFTSQSSRDPPRLFFIHTDKSYSGYSGNQNWAIGIRQHKIYIDI